MSRLGRAVQDILRSERTMGSGRVESVVRAGEIKLEGRSERVLVAGNMMPRIGAIIPWVLVSAGLLVASHNVPMTYPAPVSAAAELRFVGREAIIIDALLTGDPYWQRPYCGEDSAGAGWITLLEAPVDGDASKLHFYRGDPLDLTLPENWASATHLDYASILRGPRDGVPFAIDDADRLFGVISRGRLYGQTESTADNCQGVSGQIDAPAGTLDLDMPVDLGLPYPSGIAPNEAIIGDVAVGPDGTIWFAGVAQQWVPYPTLQLLYGDELLVGNYKYAVAYRSGSGETLIGDYASITTRATAVKPSTPSNLAKVAGGSFEAGTHYFKVTYWGDAENGDGETDGSTAASITVSEGEAPCAIAMRLSLGLPNGGRRVYHATASGGPYALALEIADATTQDVTVTAPGTGAAIPGTNTLLARRVRVRHATWAGDGTISKRVYRTQAGGATYGYVGQIPGAGDGTWDDKTSDSIGDPPAGGPKGWQYAPVVCSSNAPTTWGSGATWVCLGEWGEHACGDIAQALALDGWQLALYEIDNKIVAYYRTGGDWQGPMDLAAEAGSTYLLGRAVAENGAAALSYLRVESHPWPDAEDDHLWWGVMRLEISEGALSIVQQTEAEAEDEASGFSGAGAPMLGSVEESLVALGGVAWDSSAQTYVTGRLRLADDGLEEAADDVPWELTWRGRCYSPRIHRGTIAWLVHEWGDGEPLQIMEWRPE